MAVAFKIKTSTPGRGSAAKKIFNEKQVSDEMKKEIESVTGKAVINAVQDAFDLTNERKLYVAAMFFQWVVSRTPLDEVYQTSSGDVHEPDEDVVRNDWYIAYGGKKFCSTDFVGCFDTFNDSTSIKKIYLALSSGIKTKRNIKTIRVYNTNERFSQLEYGEYKYDSKQINEGQWGRQHGVVGGFSIQAPKGMLRLTEAEFDWIVNQAKRAKGLLARAESIRNRSNTKAVPDKRRTNAIYNYLKNKRKLKESDIGWLK